jgi:parallel beta-helix repeat protein
MTPADPLIDDRYRAALQRFRQLEHTLQQERATISKSNAEALTAQRVGIRERVRELEALHDEIVARCEAIAAHPEVRDLPEARATLSATVHDADPYVVMSEIHRRHEARVAAWLPDLGSVPPDVLTDADGSAAAPAPSPGAPDVVPGGGTAVRRCDRCGATAPTEAETCPSCGSRLRPPLFHGDIDAEPDAEPRPGRAGPAWFFFILLVAAWAGVATLNARPELLRAMPMVCDVPLLRSMVPCPGGSPARPPLAGARCDLRTSADLMRGLSNAARGRSTSLVLCQGTFEITAPLSLAGNVTMQGAAGSTVVRIVGNGSLSYTGPGTFAVSDIAFQRSTTGIGHVLTVSNATVRFDRVGFSGGRGNDTMVVSGAGLHLAGSTTGTVRDCRSSGNFLGIGVSNQARPTIERCAITNNLTRGVYFIDGSGGELRANTIANNGYDEDRRNWWQGVAVRNTASPTIRNNTVEDNAGVGIHVWEEARGIIDGNTIRNNGRNIGATGSHYGGIAIGFRGDNKRPNPTVGPNNTFTNNRGGAVNDYR